MERMQQTECLAYPQRPPPHCPPRVLLPSNDDHLLIIPKKLVNPVMDSKNHMRMQKELKINKKLGIDVLHQKSELNRVFREKKLEDFKSEQEKKAPPKSDFEIMIEKRRKDQEAQEQEKVAEDAKPEFLKIRNRLVKSDSG